jgi:hypothetical protein
MPGEVRRILEPGRSLIEGGRALKSPRRLAGRWPYQWLFPGPNSKQVLSHGEVAIPAIAGGAVNVVRYQVPDGLRFSLRGVVLDAFITDASWNEASGDLLFNVTVLAAGSRTVDYLVNVSTRLGSRFSPYPILGRLEFEPGAVLTVTVNNIVNVTAGPPNMAIAHLVGHTYPNSEVDG